MIKQILDTHLYILNRYYDRKTLKCLNVGSHHIQIVEKKRL